MPYLEELLKKAKSEVDVKKVSFAQPAPAAQAAPDVLAEDRVLIDQYDEVRIYKKRGEPLLVYEVPAPRYRGEEKALIDTLLDLAARTIRVDEALFQTSLEKRAKYLHEVLSLIDATPELKIPSHAKDFYAGAVVREMMGFGLIDPLIADDKLEEVMVIGIDRPVYVFHRKYEMMKTNIVFYSDKDVVDLIDKIARNIGRRIDISSPLLDARLPDGTRVNATISPVSLNGSTITVRKFKADPLSVIDLVNNGTLNYEIGAFLWTAVEGMGGIPANIIVAGSTASGKTTFLNILTSFVPNYERLVSIEDSVDGEEEIIVFENGEPVKTTIGKLVDGKINEDGAQFTDFGHEICQNFSGTQTLCFDEKGKLSIKTIQSFIRHKTNKKMYELTLRSGRSVKVTEDHSLFSLNDEGKIAPVKTRELAPGNFVATPRTINFATPPLEKISLLPRIAQFKSFVYGEKVRETLEKITIDELAPLMSKSSRPVMRSKLRYWKENKILPCKVFGELLKKEHFKAETQNEFWLTTGRDNSIKIPTLVEIDADFLNFIGLWLADGCYDRDSVIISADEPEVKELLERVAAKFGTTRKMHSDKFSSVIDSTLLKQVMQIALEFGGDSHTKRIPSWTIKLSAEQTGELLKGYFSGDGGVSKFEVEWVSCSTGLAHDIQTALLRMGILAKLGKRREETRSAKARARGFGNYKIKYTKGRVSGHSNIQLFEKLVGFCGERKKLKLATLAAKPAATHDSTDVIPLPASMLSVARQEFGITHSYYSGRSKLGRRYLSKLTEQKPHESLRLLAESDIFWDEVKQVKLLKQKERTVYDLSVPSFENFYCSNTFVHNTAELLLPFQHWIRLESRPPGLEGVGEISLDDLLKNSLRMRPDRIIVGEIRGGEGYTLFSAMNTGHSGSMGTLHSNSAKETMIRLTNPPMNVPPIMLNALNFIVMMQRTYDRRKGLIRRISEVAEIIPSDTGDSHPEMNVIFKWNPAPDTLEATNEPAFFLKMIERYTGLGKEAIKEELVGRRKLLADLNERGMRDLKSVCSATQDYAQKRQGKI